MKTKTSIRGARARPARRRENEYGYRSWGVGKDGLGWRTAGRDVGRGKARSPLSRVPSLGLEVITEIDAHPSDPSCSLHMCEWHTRRLRVRSFVWRPPPPPSAPRERVIDLLDTRYMGYRYGCYRRSRVRDTTRTSACRCHSHPWQIRMAHLTLWNARHPLTPVDNAQAYALVYLRLTTKLSSISWDCKAGVVCIARAIGFANFLYPSIWQRKINLLPTLNHEFFNVK